MTQAQARNTVVHALLWITSEQNMPRWAVSGVYFAKQELEKAKTGFYSNSPHRQRRCIRCAEILGVQVWGGR